MNEPLEICSWDGKPVFRINSVDQFTLYNIHPMNRDSIINEIHSGKIDLWLRKQRQFYLADSLKKLEQNVESYMFGNICWTKNKDKPNVSWSEVSGYEKQKKELMEEAKFSFDKEFSAEGIILYGPPGCGKTRLAMGFANITNSFLIQTNTDEVCNVGMVGNAFEAARAFAPSTLLLEEVDAVSKDRESPFGGSGNNTLSMIQEFDVFEKNKNMAILGTTNYPWEMDTSLMRNGRFSKRIFVGPPEKNDRFRILEQYLGETKHSVDLDKVSQETDFYSGADLKRICMLAKRTAHREGTKKISTKHVLDSIKDTPPTIVPWLAKISCIKHPEFANKYFGEMFDLQKRFEKKYDDFDEFIKKMGPGWLN